MTLQTEPNSGVPFAAFRKRPALDIEPTGHAAGVLCVAPDGDVLLLRRSSAEANYAGHWALPGGGVEADESPADGAIREAREEMGVDLDPEELKPLDLQATPTGMAFHTFALPVAEKFAPRLNGEHSGFAWAPLDKLPGPLHPAVEQTLKERIGGAADMSPDDWAGLRDGFVKWTREEERESEHVATDSALKLALDRESVREFDRDGRMHVKLANICKATVNPYYGREIPDADRLGLEPNRLYHLLRDPEELKKAVSTANGVQLLRKHIPVNAEDHQPYDVVGATGTNAEWNDPYIQNELIVWTKEAIDGIESDAKRELSPGYHYRAVMTPGKFGAKAFDGIMRDITFNHIALVEDGRQGSDVVVGDSNEEIAMSEASRIAAITGRATSVAALHAYLRPKLAKPHIAADSKPLGIMAKVFDGVTGAKFKESKPAIAKRVRELAKPMLAQDASLDDVEKVLDMLDGHEVDGGDESVSQEQHNAMEAAAHGTSNLDIPKKVGEEFAEADKGKAFDAEAFKGFLAGKGMGEDDINTAMGMLPKPTGMDADETDEEKKKREAKAAEDEAAEEKKGEEKKAMDERLKGMVDKTAMDEAIKSAVAGARERERGIRDALAFVRPWVGELPTSLAFDSGADVVRHALEMRGIPNAKKLHDDALRPVLEAQPKPGVRPERTEHMALDAAGAKSFAERFPGSERIGVA